MHALKREGGPMMTVVLARSGEYENYDPTNKKNHPLTSEGRGQVHLLAEYLNENQRVDGHIDIFVSPAKHAWETGAIMARVLGLRPAALHELPQLQRNSYMRCSRSEVIEAVTPHLTGRGTVVFIPSGDVINNILAHLLGYEDLPFDYPSSLGPGWAYLFKVRNGKLHGEVELLRPRTVIVSKLVSEL